MSSLIALVLALGSPTTAASTAVASPVLRATNGAEAHFTATVRIVMSSDVALARASADRRAYDRLVEASDGSAYPARITDFE